MKIRNKEEQSSKIKIRGELLEGNKIKLLETDKKVKKIIPGKKEGAVPPPMKLGQRGSNIGVNVKVETELRSKENVPGSSKLSIESTLGINREQQGTKKVQGKEELKSAGDAKISEHSKETQPTADNNTSLSRNKDVAPSSMKIEEAPKCSTKTGNISASENTVTLKETDRLKECELSKELQKHFSHQPKKVSCKSDEVTKTRECDNKTSTSVGTDVSAVKQEDSKKLSKSPSESKLPKKNVAAVLASKDSILEESWDIEKPITAPKTDLQIEENFTSTVEVAKTNSQNKRVKITTADNANKDGGNTLKSTIKLASLHSGKDIKEVTKSAKTSERVGATQPESARTSKAKETQSTSDKKIEQSSSSISNAGKSSTATKNLELGSRKEIASNLKETPLASGGNNGKPRAAPSASVGKEDNTDCDKAVDVGSNKNKNSVAVKKNDTGDFDSSANKVNCDARINVKNKESAAQSITSSIQEADATIKPREISTHKEMESTTKTTVSGAGGSSSKSKLASNDSNILGILAGKPASISQEKSKVDDASKVKSLSKADVTPIGGTPAYQSGNGNLGNEGKKSGGDCNESEIKETVRNTVD